METEGEYNLSIKKQFVARVKGKAIYNIFLSNGVQSATVTNLGCSIISLETPGKTAIAKNIVAGFPSVHDYLVNSHYFGCVVGRYANRIAGGKFLLEGKEIQLTINNETNHLHGGVEGFHRKTWNISNLVKLSDRVEVVFTHLSRAGEEGYPGNVQVVVTYSLNNQNRLCIHYEAITDAATPVNFTNHSYFNLTGFDSPFIYDHSLNVNAFYYTSKNEQNVPTGSIIPVEGTALDFRNSRRIGSGIDKFPADMGYDHNFVLQRSASNEIQFAARLFEPVSGRSLKVYTSQPGLQLYTANFWDGTIRGVQGHLYQKHGAVALETQAFPDSPNQPTFPNTILYPNEKYVSDTIYEFCIE